MKIKNYLTTFSQTHWLFVFIAATFGFIFIVITPPLWGIDESSHFARVYQIAHGNVIPDKDDENYGGPVPQNLIDLANYTTGDLLNNQAANPGARKDVTNVDGYKVFTDAKFSDVQHQYIWSASYSPVAYVGPVVGTFIAKVFELSVGHTILFARLGGLTVYILLVATSLYLLRKSKIKWVIFTVSLFPSIMFLASVVTADNIAIALSLLFTALFIRLQAKKLDEATFKKLLYGIILVAVLLPLIKINYIFISFGVLFIPSRHFKTKMSEVAKKIGTVIFAIGGALLWSVIAKISKEAPISQRPDGKSVSSIEQLSYVFHNPFDFIGAFLKSVILNIDSYIQSSTVLMGWNWVVIPNIFIIVLIFSTFFAAMYAKDEIRTIYTKKTMIWLAILAIAGVCSIFFALYLAFNPVGNSLIDGIQGRYFIPLMMPILILLAYFLPIQLKIQPKIVPYLFSIISIVCLIAGTSYYFLALY